MSPDVRSDPARRDAPTVLLDRLTRPAEDEYAVAARRGSRARTGRAGLLVFGAAVAALAVLITVSALQTQAAAPQAEQDREALVSSIEAEEAQVADVRQRVETLAGEVEDLRTRSVDLATSLAEAEAELADLGVVVGAAPTQGPGVRVTIDDAPSGSAEGTILDTDLQLLVNGLWEAGAEAVAINGQRLSTLTAIRTAGSAITVNFRPLTPPYVVSAIGDPDVLPARLLETSAGQGLTDLQANFGIGFAVDTVDILRLPAASRLTLRQASASGPGEGRS